MNYFSNGLKDNCNLFSLKYKLFIIFLIKQKIFAIIGYKCKLFLYIKQIEIYQLLVGFKS